MSGKLKWRYCWRGVKNRIDIFFECGEGMVVGHRRICAHRIHPRCPRVHFCLGYPSQRKKASRKSRLESSDEWARAQREQPLKKMGLSKRSRTMFRCPDSHATPSYSPLLVTMRLRPGRTVLPALTVGSLSWRSCGSGERFLQSKGQGRNADS